MSLEASKHRYIFFNAVVGFAQKLPRLCRLMCGRPLAFRQDCLLDFGLRPICWGEAPNSL
jgi:hypothetical protein